MITEMCTEAVEFLPTEPPDSVYAHQDLDFRMGDQGHWVPYMKEDPLNAGAYSVMQQLWTTYPIWTAGEHKAYQRSGGLT